MSKVVTLTKKHLQTEIGSQLASLCQRLLEDGRLSDVEIGELKFWLDQNESSELPAAAFLTAAIDEVLEDEQVSESERSKLHRALERVLPKDLREEVIQARKDVVQADQLAKGRIVTFSSKVRGVTFANKDGSSRAEIISRLRPGDSLWPVRDREVPGHPNAIKLLTDRGEQVGYIATGISSPEGEEGLAARMGRGIRVECRVKNVTGAGKANRGVNIEIAYWKGYPEGQPTGPLLPPFVREWHASRTSAQKSGCLQGGALYLGAAVLVFGLMIFITS